MITGSPLLATILISLSALNETRVSIRQHTLLATNLILLSALTDRLCMHPTACVSMREHTCVDRQVAHASDSLLNYGHIRRFHEPQERRQCILLHDLDLVHQIAARKERQ